MRLPWGEPIWVAEGIWQDSSSIFGWCEVEPHWHIAVGERETCPDPDSGETITYGSSPKKILQCEKGVQRQVFRKAQLLIGEIHRHLKRRHDDSRKAEEEIVNQINDIEGLLKTEGWPNQSLHPTGPA